MAQDFAKRKKDSGKRKPAPRKKPSQRRTSDKSAASSTASSFRGFVAGLLTGAFLSFLVYLGTAPSSDNPVQVNQTAAAPKAQPPKPRFDFYNLLPKQTIEVDVERAADVSKPPANPAAADVYILQAGSFRQREDADRRRAELLLLGLEPTIEETEGDNGRWSRVYLGPFETHSSMSRARSLTANQDIDTLLLKRDRP
jgi:cell division protein FtsN